MKTRDRTADLLELATVATAALLGGLLALVALWIITGLQLQIMLFVVIVVTLLAVLTVGSLQTSPKRRRAPDPGARAPRPPLQPAPPRSAPSPFGQHPAARHEPSDAATKPTFAPVLALAPPPDLRPPAYETFAVPGAPRTSGPPVRRIVQCPGCGDFDVDVRRGEGDELAFTCRQRHHQWTWARGRPWPATVVRPAATPARDTGTV